MKGIEIQCAHCGNRFELRYHRRRRLVAAGAGALVGLIVTDGVVGTVVFAGLTYVAARVVDQYLARRCPHCDVVAPRAAAEQAVEYAAAPEAAAPAP